MPLIIHEPKTYEEAYKLFNNKIIEVYPDQELVITSTCLASELDVQREYHALDECRDLQKHFVCVKIDPESCKKLLKTFAKVNFEKDFTPNYYFMVPRY